MDKFLNEELFEVVLEKAFIEHEKELLKSYPDDVELEREYPISKKEIRRFKNIVKEKEYGKKLIRVYFDRAAVVVLCMISLFFTLVMTNSEVRAAVENVILKWYDKYTEFIFTEATTGLVAEKIEDVEIGYIPEGFELSFEDNMEIECFKQYTHIDDPSSNFILSVFYNNEENLFYDNEKLKYKEILINSKEAWIAYDEIEKKGGIILLGDCVSVNIAGNLSEDELIKIAENIK